jgi:hypothetical protein
VYLLYYKLCENKPGKIESTQKSIFRVEIEEFVGANSNKG